MISPYKAAVNQQGSLPRVPPRVRKDGVPTPNHDYDS